MEKGVKAAFLTSFYEVVKLKANTCVDNDE